MLRAFAAFPFCAQAELCLIEQRSFKLPALLPDQNRRHVVDRESHTAVVDEYSGRERKVVIKGDVQTVNILAFFYTLHTYNFVVKKLASDFVHRSSMIVKSDIRFYLFTANITDMNTSCNLFA